MTRSPRTMTFAALILATLVGLRAASVEARPTNVLAGAPHQFATRAQIDAFLTRVHFRGYMLLTRHGHTILSQGYGLADAKRAVPNTIRTRFFAFGSEQLMFAVATLRLQQQGKLSLADRLCTYISACPKPWRSIALQNMLNSTSGLTSGTLAIGSQPLTRARIIKACKSTPLAGTPGTYSEDRACNRVFLSIVLAKVAKAPIARLMHELVFAPAGMTNTSIVNRVPTQSVRGYESGAPAPPWYVRGYPAIYSTVEDIWKFDRALRTTKLISNSSRDAIFTPYVADGPGSPVHLGLGTNLTEPDQWLVICDQCSGMSASQTSHVAWQVGGPDGSGLSADNFISPDDDAAAIWTNNDTGYVPSDSTENTFIFRSTRLLWGR